MIWLIVSPLVAFYVLGYVFAFRRIAGQLAWHFSANDYMRREFPDGGQWFGAICLGLAFGLVWPLTLSLAYGIASSRTGGRFFYTPPRVREHILQNRIRELEREAGIRG